MQKRLPITISYDSEGKELGLRPLVYSFVQAALFLKYVESIPQWFHFKWGMLLA
jgi:hypothetical protein